MGVPLINELYLLLGCGGNVWLHDRSVYCGGGQDRGDHSSRYKIILLHFNLPHYQLEGHSPHPITHSLTGDDLESLLFHLLDEFLFTFSADPFFIPKVCSHCVVLTVSLFHYCTESKNHRLQQGNIQHQSGGVCL